MNVDTYAVEDNSHLAIKEILGHISELLTVPSAQGLNNKIGKVYFGRRRSWSESLTRERRAERDSSRESDAYTRIATSQKLNGKYVTRSEIQDVIQYGSDVFENT